MVKTSVTFIGDPGYNATSKMLSEAGICLTDPSCHDPNGESRGGVMTAASGMGFGLIRRLQAVDKGNFMGFNVLDR